MEATSTSRGVKNHAIRSGVNFMVQSPSSDINLLASIEAFDWIETNKYENDILPFALVHDSIVAEVKIELVPAWCQIIKTAVQRDRGLSIPNCPIGVDFEVGPTWALLKGINADRVTVVEVRDILENKRYIKQK